ncbi:MAG: tetratricopeptide repeat protein [Trueperaceae bacterium]
MKKLLFSLVIGSFLPTIALAQTAKRIVVLPFNATSSIEAYGVGLATSLQRSLNAVDNVYVPPIGDAFQVTQTLLQTSQESLTPENVAQAFESSVVVAGAVQDKDGVGNVLLGFSGPDYAETKEVVLEVPLDSPEKLVQAVADAVIKELVPEATANDLREVAAINTQVPSAPSLNAVSDAALRISITGLNALETAMQLDVNSSWVNTEYARELAIAGDTQRADEISLKATELQALDIEAQVTRGIILRSAGNTEGALQAFDAALAINPTHAVALAGKGAVQGDATLLENAISIYPRQVDAYTELAALQEESDPTRALQTLRNGAQAVPESTALNRAFMQQVIEQGDVAGAVSYLQSITGAANAPANLYSLVTLLPPENQEQALAIVREGRTIYPDNPNIAILESDLLSRAKDYEGAEAVLQDALGKNPNNPDVVNALAVVQSTQGKIDEAIATFNSVNTDPDAQMNLARLLIQVGENQAALDALTPRVTANPNDAELQALYGLSLRGVGRADEAKAAFDQALAIDPNNELAQSASQLSSQQQDVTGGQAPTLNADAQAAFEQGESKLANRDLEGALADFQQARQLQDNGLTAFYEGLVLQQLGRTREAVPAYERALQDYPESDTILNNLGYAHLLLGRMDLALENLNKAVSIDSSNDQAYLNLGLAYYNLNNFTDAVKAFDAALAINPNQPEQALEIIEETRTKAGQ